ncbi:MAG: hypothetical protein RI993_775 [Pseudomonadota bacterium]|jgi:methionine-rich copper-binding protein CopC|nr:copper resistance protein CopC [Nitrosomonas sp.]
MPLTNSRPLNKIFYFLTLLFILFSWPTAVFAHAIMVKSSPEVDSHLSDNPTQVDIWFNEKIGSAYLSLAVINSKGERVDNKDFRQAKLDPSHIYVTTTPLSPDTYTVRYRVMSADTHIITGRFNFTIQPAEGNIDTSQHTQKQKP